MQVPIKLLGESLGIPTRAHTGDAGCDLRSTSEPVELSPGQRMMFSTGVAVAIPEGYAGFILPRSGLAAKQGISVINTPGLIDSGYRGEIKVALINHGDGSVLISRGDRIAQLVVMPVPEVEFVRVAELDQTVRGDGGFGSTGIG